MKRKYVPLRTCVGCKEVRPKEDLIRVVRTPQGEVLVDSSGKLAGRGAYLCPKSDCLKQALKKKAIQRTLNINSADWVGKLDEAISR